jgi:VIT1/CCC1 family predicted Fe2+/Mn2+ transporter
MAADFAHRIGALADSRRRRSSDHRIEMSVAADNAVTGGSAATRSFLLQRVQPAMTGLIDGSLSTLAPIFSVAIATHNPHTAFLAGIATALGAGVSMAFSEGLSDTGALTGRGSPYLRGAITGIGTFLGGIFHTLPFLIPHYRAALIAAVIVITIELLSLAWLRWRFFQTRFLASFASIALGGAIITGLSAALGSAG